MEQGLYFQSLIDGLVKIPEIPPKFRNKIRQPLQKKDGQKKFYKKLLKIDPGLIINFDLQMILKEQSELYEVKSFTKKSMYLMAYRRN